MPTTWVRRWKRFTVNSRIVSFYQGYPVFVDTIPFQCKENKSMWTIHICGIKYSFQFLFSFFLFFFFFLHLCYKFIVYSMRLSAVCTLCFFLWIEKGNAWDVKLTMKWHVSSPESWKCFKTRSKLSKNKLLFPLLLYLSKNH